MRVVDYRSDTFTLPSKEMMDAIYNAKLGDDVFNEDPTVKKLEKLAAEIMSKEAALLVPTGTMGNLISVLVHCGRGDEIILGDQSHIFIYEAGGISALGGVFPHILKNNDDGTIEFDSIKSAIRMKNIHFPVSKLICLENTHNRCNGSPIAPEYINQVAEIAHTNNMKLHIDGARIFNAASALNIDVKELVTNADSVMFCLSKGLSAPIGSMICGSKEFIEKALHQRKQLGGGMRQAGIIAAAGIVALEKMTKRIDDDHRNLKTLADAISKIDSLSIDFNTIKSNILYFDIQRYQGSIEDAVNALKDEGILCFNVSDKRIRFVTHYGIDEDDVKYTIEILNKVFK